MLLMPFPNKTYIFKTIPIEIEISQEAHLWEIPGQVSNLIIIEVEFFQIWELC
jgi:hypothetical protein